MLEFYCSILCFSFNHSSKLCEYKIVFKTTIENDFI